MNYEDVIGVEAVKERFMGNYGMFSMYLYQFAEGALFRDLENALKDGDASGGFEIAHDMKGVVLNLSLKLLENPIFPVVESLRDGHLPEEEVWKAFEDAYALTVENIERLKVEDKKLF